MSETDPFAPPSPAQIAERARKAADVALAEADRLTAIAEAAELEASTEPEPESPEVDSEEAAEPIEEPSV
jgi:hypothetical protein